MEKCWARHPVGHDGDVLLGLHVGDVETIAGLMRFGADTPENREAFTANFSPAVRAKYGTLERLCAVGFFSAGVKGDQRPDDAFQILSVRPDERRAGQMRVRVWFRTAGREFEGGDRYARWFQPAPQKRFG